MRWRTRLTPRPIRPQTVVEVDSLIQRALLYEDNTLSAKRIYQAVHVRNVVTRQFRAYGKAAFDTRWERTDESTSTTPRGVRASSTHAQRAPHEPRTGTRD